MLDSASTMSTAAAAMEMESETSNTGELQPSADESRRRASWSTISDKVSIATSTIFRFASIPLALIAPKGFGGSPKVSR